MTSETNKVTGALIALLISAALAGAAGQSTRAASAVRPDVRHGQELFKTCLVCHGTDGMGTPDGNVPIIAGQFSSVIVKQVTDFRTARFRSTTSAGRKTWRGSNRWRADGMSIWNALPRGIS